MDAAFFRFIGELFQNGNTILIPVVVYFMWNNNVLLKSITGAIKESTKAMQKTSDIIEKCTKR